MTASWSRLSIGVLCAVLPAIAVVNACGAEGEIEEISEAQQALTTVSFQQGSLPSSSYAGSTDATIRQAAATTNYGGATTCEADGDDGSGVDKSCLLKWTLSGIPAGSTVQSASITLQVTDGSSNTYNVYEVKRSWDESQVTWNNATSTTAWATAGAMGSTDRGNLVGSVTGSAGSRTITLNAAGVALVQAWVDGTSNNGIVIASSSNTDGIDFASSEHATAAQRPKLTITYGSSSGTGSSTDPGLLIAFIGDQGNNGNADAVLDLIKNEGAAATIHNGDFDYANSPAAWENRINSILGPNYPYFAIIGNHDAAAWGGSSGYASYIQARHARVPDMNCTGELGVKATCNFHGLFIVQSCIGTSELRSTCAANAADQVSFIQDALANDSSIWSVCAWHKNQADMQVGGKSNEVGWSAYQACMNAGAIVATGHEHSYSRTLTLTDVGNASTGHGKTGAFDLVELGPNRNFVFVSGLGGVGIRDYEAASHDDDTWWSSYYASNKWVKNGTLMSGTADYGALFIRFNVGGDPKRATAYFKDVDGRLADEFTIQVQ
ncbi:DNRLRE domain-containing protein [Sorangium sp. Soce836]|uniref:DNRLRE domain-containing protein n=1 Tax=Sorangium sp. So ce836 TaxID=2969250 RepID=UPI00235031E1|nr:DNRLRE domain-containing protein [Sorangium sp. Soce836]